jgi:hypothetical protein
MSDVEFKFPLLSPTSKASITWTLEPDSTVDRRGLSFHNAGLIWVNGPASQIVEEIRDPNNPLVYRAKNLRTAHLEHVYFPVIFFDPLGTDGKPDPTQRILCAAADPKIINTP